MVALSAQARFNFAQNSLPPCLRVALRCRSNNALSFSPVDNNVREYALVGEQLTPVATLPTFSAPRWISVDKERTSVLLSDWDTDEVNLCVSDGHKWVSVRSLARDTPAHIDIRSISLMGPNMLVILDLKSMSVLLYDFA